MERATMARPYAEAVAQLAAAGDAWQGWSERLALLAAVAGDEQVAALAANPSVPADRVIELIDGVCGVQLGAEGRNLLAVLAENKRLALLDEIVAQFEAIKTAREGVLDAHITSAYPLSEAQLAALGERLQQRFGRKVNVTQSVDPELIGGVLIRVGDEVMDASVRGGLHSLAATLKA